MSDLTPRAQLARRLRVLLTTSDVAASELSESIGVYTRQPCATGFTLVGPAGAMRVTVEDLPTVNQGEPHAPAAA